MLLVTLMLMVNPLLQSIIYIRAEKPLPIKGSKEFQVLAKTYNLMFEANRERKEQLAFEATHDRLTEVYNRNGYDFICKNTDWDSAALILFDLDRFKPINDTYGHKMGDMVLARVARTISNAFRSQDYVCRIGGDEFAVIMVHTDPGSADLIRKKVDSINKSLSASQDGIPPVHLSCGAAYGVLIKDYDKRFKAADAALYRVKNSGGSGCEVCL
jgi:diguanylate cyclase (GGDEF)-like protein